MRAGAFVLRAATLCALVSITSGASARSGGLAALGCDGCHSGGKPATVTLSAQPASAGVGEPITLTITVSQTNGASAGFYLTTAFDSPGTFRAVQSGTATDSAGVLHTAPRSGSGGATTFEVQWTASAATGASFDVFALSANGDKSNRGDGAGSASLSLVVGCAGQRYYIDQDGDGYGSDDPAFRSREECSAPLGYAGRAGDCNDFRAEVHPGAAELCDLLDNDCNQQVDDDVVSQLFCQDDDGDGHGVPGRATKMDCKPVAGFGACDGDCDDGDANYHPGAEEVCDLRDNDCDGMVDEDVRTSCGLGLCARRARGCNAADCTPGEPLVETCNGYDDDCDGIVDNGDSASLCGETGERCVTGRCEGGAGAGGTPGAIPTAGAGSGAGPPSEAAPEGNSASGAGCQVAAGPRDAGCLFGAALLALGSLARRRRVSAQYAR
ncbi:MAG: hypothetical protein EOO73_20390 [Myxococcales bacterium]|nr:MAG: hypothetical protein EOO73_20390 [Myxococcales bacterium]